MANLQRDLSPDSLVLQCVDLRRRLRQTEKSLQGLSDLERSITEGDNDQDDIRCFLEQDNPASGTVTSPLTVPLLTMDDLSPRNQESDEVQDGLNTSNISSSLGSFRAFKTPGPPSSTPKQQPSRPRYAPETSNYRHSVSAESTSVVREEILRLQDERRLLKEEIVLLREENSQLLNRNQVLVHNAEKGRLDTKKLSEKMRLLLGELGKYRSVLPDLEEKVISLTAETKSQDTALRDAEERCEKTQKELADAQAELRGYKAEHCNCGEEITSEKKLRKRMESQRDLAVEELGQLQALLNTYQKKAKEKIVSLESREDHLRESLAFANQEREDLLESSSQLHQQLYDLEEEIRQVKQTTGAELEAKEELEKTVQDLKCKLAQQTKQIASLKFEVQDTEALRKQNANLTAKVESQEGQLIQCQKEISDSRQMLEQLEKLAEQVQNTQGKRIRSTNDSGVGSINGESGRNHSSDSRLSDGKSPKSVNQSDFRMVYSLKEAQSHGSASRTAQLKTASFVESLRSELLTTIEKGRLCERKSQEMELMLAQLESERTQLRKELVEAQREAADRDAICRSLESRLKQRENQMTELQSELSLKNASFHNLERELRKKSAQMSSLEEQLDEKVGEFTMHVTRLKLQEDDVANKMTEIQDLRTEVTRKEKQLRDLSSAGEKVRRIQQEQFQEFEKQIDILQGELEKKIKETQDLSYDNERMTSDLEVKDKRVEKLENQLDIVTKELNAKRSGEKKILAELESQTGLATNQIKELETALVVCREEMKVYIQQLDQSKEQFDRDLADKNKQVSVLDRQLKEAFYDLEEKDQHITELERRERDQQAMLQQSSVRIAELENSQADLQTQVSRLEQKLLKEKGEWVEESRCLERKLHQACVDLELRTSQFSELTTTMKTLQSEKMNIDKDLKTADKQLIEEQEETSRCQRKIGQLEKEIRDLRVMVEQKTEMIQDLEDQMKCKTDSIERQRLRQEERDNRLEDVKAEVQLQKDKVMEFREQLQHCQFDCKAKEQLLEDMRESFRRLQEDLNESRERVRELEKALEERLWELHQRAAQVSKLETTIKDYQDKVEQRSVEQRDELQSVTADLQERTKQLSSVDDRLQESQYQLREANLQLQQSQQMIGRLEQDLRDRTNRLQALERRLEVEKAAQVSQKEELSEVTQELRLTREQLQKQHGEITHLRQDIRESEQALEKLSRDLERTSNTSKTRHAETESLLREVEVLQEREKLAESRLSAETTRHQQEVERMSRLHQDEVSQLQDSYAKVLSSNEELSAQSRLHQKTLEENKQQTEREIMEMKTQIRNLEEEIHSKDVLIDSVQETVVLKDAEIARLEARISRFERDVGMKAAEKWLSSRDQNTESSAYLADLSRSKSSNLDEKSSSMNFNNGAVQNWNLAHQGEQERHLPGFIQLPYRSHPAKPQRQEPQVNQVSASGMKSFENGGLFEISDTDSDGGMRRCFAEVSEKSSPSNPVPTSNYANLNNSQNNNNLARALTFDDCSSNTSISNSSNNEDSVHIPTRDSEPRISKSCYQVTKKSDPTNGPRKSALKNGKGGATSQSGRSHQNSRQSGQKNGKTGQMPQQSRQYEQLQSIPKPDRSLHSRGIPGPSAKRKSANFEVHDFENEVTAVQQFRSPVSRPSDTSDLFLPAADVTGISDDGTLSVEDLQEKLRANELKQQEIDRELMSLETDFEVSQDAADISQ